MTAGCRPPAGTPDGALCVLFLPPRSAAGLGAVRTWLWEEGAWRSPRTDARWSVETMRDVGWRFERMAGAED